MGTEQDEISQLWDQLDEELKKAGFTGPKFAERYFYETWNSDDEKELKKFLEIFKSHQKRNSTTPRMMATVEDYLRVLHEQPEYQNRVDRIPARRDYHPENEKGMSFEMRKISRMIDESLSDMESSDE